MTYSKKRTDFNNNWPNAEIEFEGQKYYHQRLALKEIRHILVPIKLPLIDTREFQRLLSFKIDIYEQLPNRPDIAFDLAWRNFEAYCCVFANRGNWTTSKTYKITNKVCEDILINQVNSNTNLSLALEQLFDSIPLQATEFLIRRLFEPTSLEIESQQKKIRERVKEVLGDSLYDAIEAKYGSHNPVNQRKAGMLLQILISGKVIILNGSNFQIGKLQTLKLIINGLLYTYRNERFHGDAFSPFKSSKTTLKTYAHSFYCLVATYFFICQLIYQDIKPNIDLTDIANQLNENIHRYNLVFKDQQKK